GKKQALSQVHDFAAETVTVRSPATVAAAAAAEAAERAAAARARLVSDVGQKLAEGLRPLIAKAGDATRTNVMAAVGKLDLPLEQVRDLLAGAATLESLSEALSTELQRHDLPFPGVSAAA